MDIVIIKEKSLCCVGSDPSGEISGVGVDSGVVGSCASLSPGGDSSQSGSRVEWATAVSLASVASGSSSADHTGEDGVLSVRRTARSNGDHWNGDLHQDSWDVSSLSESSPSSSDNISRGVE